MLSASESPQRKVSALGSFGKRWPGVEPNLSVEAGSTLFQGWLCSMWMGGMQQAPRELRTNKSACWMFGAVYCGVIQFR